MTEVERAKWLMQEADRHFQAMEVDYYASVRNGLNTFSLDMKQREFRRLMQVYNASVDRYLYAVLAEKEAECKAARILFDYALVDRRGGCAIFQARWLKAMQAHDHAAIQAANRSSYYQYWE